LGSEPTFAGNVYNEKDLAFILGHGDRFIFYGGDIKIVDGHLLLLGIK